MAAKISFAETVATLYARDYGITIDFDGTSSKKEPQSWLAPCLSELISNCPAVRQTDDVVFRDSLTGDEMTIGELKEAYCIQAELNRQRGYRIRVTLNESNAAIEDNFEHPDPSVPLANINRAVESPRPFTTKKRGGGCGIYTIKRTLSEHQGKLEYKQVGKRIMVTMNWEVKT